MNIKQDEVNTTQHFFFLYCCLIFKIRINKLQVMFLVKILKGYMTESNILEMGLLSMGRSKLEVHIEILKVLARHGPLKLTHIMYKANVNFSVLKQYLDFLTQHNLVEEQTLHKKRNKIEIVYAITERGRTALKYFWELNNALQITEEANKIPASLY
jgi:predicted transcriptional regulator